MGRPRSKCQVSRTRVQPCRDLRRFLPARRPGQLSLLGLEQRRGEVRVLALSGVSREPTVMTLYQLRFCPFCGVSLLQLELFAPAKGVVGVAD